MKKVPAWQVQAPGSSYSDDNYVFILTDELDEIGWPKTRLVNRLTPVDLDKQERLWKIRPTFIADMDDVEKYLSVVDENGNEWHTTEASLADPTNKRMGLVVAHAIIDGVDTVSNFSLIAWKQGRIVYGCDWAHEALRFEHK